MVKACASGLCHNNNKKQPDKVFALFVQPEGRGADLGYIFILRKHLFTGKSLSEALLFAEHGENMCFCTQHVLPRFELGIFIY